MKKLIVFLIRKHMGLKENERFRFIGQKSNAVYYFARDAVMKVWHGNTTKSSVSLNWLLDDDCEIRKCSDEVRR